MSTPNMSNIPGAAVVTDTLDFVKNLWGSLGVPGVSIPGIAAPTLSVDELDKKIGDLKAVESWLNVNMSMLRGTIQALEVQRSTIATLKSMGATLAAATKQPGADPDALRKVAPLMSAFFSQAMPESATVAEPPAPAAPAKPVEASAPAADPAAPMNNPGAWWNLLQDQFKHAVSTAMNSETLANATAMAQDAATKLTAVARPIEVSVTAPIKASAKAAPAKNPSGVTTAAKRAPAKPRASKPKPAK